MKERGESDQRNRSIEVWRLAIETPHSFSKYFCASKYETLCQGVEEQEQEYNRHTIPK